MFKNLFDYSKCSDDELKKKNKKTLIASLVADIVLFLSTIGFITVTSVDMGAVFQTILSCLTTIGASLSVPAVIGSLIAISKQNKEIEKRCDEVINRSIQPAIQKSDEIKKENEAADEVLLAEQLTVNKNTQTQTNEEQEQIIK